MPHATIVAQTPFQLLGALIIARHAELPCDLWLIDPTLAVYLEPCRASGIWRNVQYAEKNGGSLWSSSFSARIRRLGTFLRSRARIRRYLDAQSPQTICIFSDNHELTACFAEHRKRRPQTAVVLVEEGVTVHLPPDRDQAPFWKGVCRKALGISNPWGYSIGWSPQVNRLLLSDPKKTHPKYLNGRPCESWPRGPYPDAAVRDFISLAGAEEVLPDAAEVDLVYLGTPMSEEGVVTLAEEQRLVTALVSFGTTWIKPHPFDTPDKYDFCKSARIFPKSLNSVPAEILFHLLRPRVVISYFSSAAFNYCTRYGKGAVFFLPPGAPGVLREIIEQHFLDVPTLRLVDDLDAIPGALNELMALDAAAPPPGTAATGEWDWSVTRTLRAFE